MYIMLNELFRSISVKKNMFKYMPYLLWIKFCMV